MLVVADGAAAALRLREGPARFAARTTESGLVGHGFALCCVLVDFTEVLVFRPGLL